MPASLDVIALISGGKDSLYSILHCIKHGHKVIALANLHPVLDRGIRPDDTAQAPNQEDINSFMYQTVGHSLIPLFAEALDLPLYRQEITGTAVQTGRDYDTSRPLESLDETEDLLVLLQKVKKYHPTANAICSGAILSTYQRTRIESVAIRLDLTPLAYLWQYPALPPPPERHDSLVGLLDDMDAAGCDARMVKLASGGLKETMIWANVADFRTRTLLMNGMSRYYKNHELSLRGAILGEGGEYETLAVNGPPALWKKKIQIDNDQVIAISGEGGTTSARISGAELLVNEVGEVPSDTTSIVRQPALLDPQFKAILNEHRHIVGDHTKPYRLKDEIHLRFDALDEALSSSINPGPSLSRSEHSRTRLESPGCISSHASHLVVSSEASYSSDSHSAAEEMSLLVTRIMAKLGSHGISTSQIAFSLLLVSNMADFASVNALYATLFTEGKANPPARATIAVDLPPGVRVSLLVLADTRLREPGRRKGLHVQSRSYWAPANIGPYSQAICEPLSSTTTSVDIDDSRLPEVVHLAGQIPLVPHTMVLANQCFCYSAILSLQHLWRVGQERGVDLWPWMVAFLATHNEDVRNRVYTIDWVGKRAYENAVGGEDSDDEDGAEDVDVWNKQHNLSSSYHQYSEKALPAIGRHLHALPNKHVLANACPLVIAEVKGLPRDASVEWWSTGVGNLAGNMKDVRVECESLRDECGSTQIISILPKQTTVVEKSVDGDSQEGTRRLNFRKTYFITYLVQRQAETRRLKDGIDRILDHIEDMTENTRQADAGSGTQGRKQQVVVRLVSGTAFTSSCGTQEQDMMQLWPESVACVPCRSVWGRLGGELSREPGKDHTVRQLMAAICLRVEEDVAEG